MLNIKVSTLSRFPLCPLPLLSSGDGSRGLTPLMLERTYISFFDLDAGVSHPHHLLLLSSSSYPTCPTHQYAHLILLFTATSTSSSCCSSPLSFPLQSGGTEQSEAIQMGRQAVVVATLPGTHHRSCLTLPSSPLPSLTSPDPRSLPLLTCSGTELRNYSHWSDFLPLGSTPYTTFVGEGGGGSGGGGGGYGGGVDPDWPWNIYAASTYGIGADNPIDPQV